MRQQELTGKIRREIESWLASPQSYESQWRDLVALVPHTNDLLIALIREPRIPWDQKGRLGMALAYVMSPLDLFPEDIWGAVGYLDDLAVACVAMKPLTEPPYREFVARHWKGPGDPREQMDHVLRRMDKAIGRRRFQRIWSHIMPESPMPEDEAAPA